MTAEPRDYASIHDHPDVYRLAYAIGVYDSGPSRNEYRLSPNCKARCCDQPKLALGLHLRHVAAEMSADPLVSEILATIDPEGLPKQSSDEQQSIYWLGYYQGRARRYHDDRKYWTEALTDLEA